ITAIPTALKGRRTGRCHHTKAAPTRIGVIPSTHEFGDLIRSVARLLVLPVLVSGCLPDGRSGVPWYEARRDPTGLAPGPASTPEAVFQIYAARTVSWRGVFAVHTWLALKATGAERYTRYEALGFGVAN